MRVSSAFPSNYLRADDLNGKLAKVTIDKIVMEDIGDGHKPVVYFKGKQKGLVLNKTNAGTLAMDFGDEMDDWVGGQIELFSQTVSFQGRMVPAIRVRTAAPPPPPSKEPSVSDDLDDEIPF